MGVALVLLGAVLAFILLLGVKVLFGAVVSCCSFAFPLGLIGIVGIGVSLNFLLDGPLTNELRAPTQPI